MVTQTESALDPIEALIASIAPIADTIKTEAEAAMPNLDLIVTKIAEIAGIVSTAKASHA